MKKVITAVLALCLMMVLAGCAKANIVTGYKKGDVTLGQYKGLTYTPASVSVSDDEVDERIDSELKSYAEDVEVTDRAVKDGDTVNIDYVGKVDGVAFDKGSATGQDLLIGSGRMIPGFEDGIIGMMTGETKIIDVTFPDTYSNDPDLAGKPATFDITVNKITESVVPELTDEYVSSNDKIHYATVADYRAGIRAELEAEAKENAESKKYNDILQAAINNAKFNSDMTEAIANIKTGLYTNYNNLASSYGIDAATLFSYMYGISTDQFDAYIETQAKSNAQYNFLLSAIVDAEKIKASEEEIKEYAESLLENYNVDNVDALYKMITESTGNDGKSMVAEQVKLNKASDVIVNSAVAE